MRLKIFIISLFVWITTMGILNSENLLEVSRDVYTRGIAYFSSKPLIGDTTQSQQ